MHSVVVMHKLSRFSLNPLFSLSFWLRRSVGRSVGCVCVIVSSLTRRDEMRRFCAWCNQKSRWLGKCNRGWNERCSAISFISSCRRYRRHHHQSTRPNDRPTDPTGDVSSIDAPSSLNVIVYVATLTVVSWMRSSSYRRTSLSFPFFFTWPVIARIQLTKATAP